MSKKKFIQNITIENTSLLFRNFAGKPSQYNPIGIRNFCCILDEESAKKMELDGWDVKQLKPKIEGDEPVSFIKIECSYKNIAPLIYIIHQSEDGSKRTVKLNEDDLSVLDYAEIINADLQIRPYNWEVGAKTGIKAYLKSLYVTVPEDKLEARYLGLNDNDDTY